jgi:hypothetical protein
MYRFMDGFVAKYSLPEEAKRELQELIGAKQFVFGKGHKQRLLDMWGIVAISQKFSTHQLSITFYGKHTRALTVETY